MSKHEYQFGLSLVKQIFPEYTLMLIFVAVVFTVNFVDNFFK